MPLKNNKGFSLIELIVGVVILGLISAPLLSMFITSSRTSMVSREMGDSTVIAENILEEFNGMDIQSWSTNIGGVDILTPGQIDSSTSGTVNGSFLTSVTDAVSGNTSIQEASYINTPKPDDSNYYDPYQIIYRNVTSNNSTFDVRVTLDPGAPEITTVEGNKIPADSYNELNEIEMSKYTPTNNAFNQSFDNNLDETMWQSYLLELRNSGYLDNVEIDSQAVNAQRTITLSVYTDSTDSSIIHAGVTYDYEFSHPIDASTTYDFTSGLIPITSADGIDLTSDDIPTFYLMFYPWYYGKSSTEDVIIIEKDGDYEINTILIKKVNTLLTPAQLTAYEAAYDASVYFIQPYSQNLVNQDNLAEIFVNGTLMTNLDDRLDNPLNSTDIPDNITYYIYNGSSTYVSYGLDSEDSIVLSEKNKRIYHITVELFDSNTDFTASNIAPYYSVSGTKLH